MMSKMHMFHCLSTFLMNLPQKNTLAWQALKNFYLKLLTPNKIFWKGIISTYHWHKTYFSVYCQETGERCVCKVHFFIQRFGWNWHILLFEYPKPLIKLTASYSYSTNWILFICERRYKERELLNDYIQYNSKWK